MKSDQVSLMPGSNLAQTDETDRW